MPALVQVVSEVFGLHCLIYVTEFVNTKLSIAYVDNQKSIQLNIRIEQGAGENMERNIAELGE
jgi:hypothetical protein